MKNIFITIKKELRAIIRDKKSLAMMLATPFLIPVCVILFSFSYNVIMHQADVGDEFLHFGVDYGLGEEESQIINNLKLVARYYADDSAMEQSYEAGEIDAYVTVSGQDQNHYIIHANTNAKRGYITSSRIIEYLSLYNLSVGQSYLSSFEDVDPEKVYANNSYEIVEIPGDSDLISSIIMTGFVFSIMAITMTAVYCATDSTAGEKEHGTLETILTFPIKSTELIAGKYLAVVIACFITSMLSLVLTILSLQISSSIFEIYENTIFNFTPASISLALIIMFIYSIFISAITIAIASIASTFKEAESFLTPLSFVPMIPMFMTILEVEVTPLISVIPIVNHTLLINDLFLGNVSYVNILLMFISTLVITAGLLFYISKQYKSEKIIFSV